MGTLTRGAPFTNYFVEARKPGGVWYPRVVDWADQIFREDPPSEEELVRRNLLAIVKPGEAFTAEFQFRANELLATLMKDSFDKETLLDGIYEVRVVYVPSRSPGEPWFSHRQLWETLTSNVIAIKLQQ